ncbi:MAG: DUF3791 domain-containing protein [Spirochaetaceae bacterium]|nr:DUF3791 domain-containing protein [Spirochaetaceae bacterium]
MSQNIFEFVVYMLHACADKWSQIPAQVYKTLTHSGCISQLLVPYYDILHTQGTAFVVSDIEEFLSARGVAYRV